LRRVAARGLRRLAQHGSRLPLYITIGKIRI
jgi:hypothetical protein